MPPLRLPSRLSWTLFVHETSSRSSVGSPAQIDPPKRADLKANPSRGGDAKPKVSPKARLLGRQLWSTNGTQGTHMAAKLTPRHLLAAVAAAATLLFAPGASGAAAANAGKSVRAGAASQHKHKRKRKHRRRRATPMRSSATLGAQAT